MDISNILEIPNLSRVTGIAFHPSKNWLATSHFDGLIKVWNYKDNKLICTIITEEDKSSKKPIPRRAISFHPIQSLLATGSDTSRVIVWELDEEDFKFHKVILEYNTHDHHIRSVEFHGKFDWILSTSDDMLIEIWNYKKSIRLAILTGHQNAVTCALYHPYDNIIVSSSLDKTIKIWNTEEIKKFDVLTDGSEWIDGVSEKESFIKKNDKKAKIVDKYIKINTFVELKGHSKGVNWIDLSSNYILSCSDDKRIIVWKKNESGEYKVLVALSAHFQNITNCLFFKDRHDLEHGSIGGKLPEYGALLSVSEDKTIRIWVNDSHVTLSKERDRIYCAKQNLNNNMIAIGHENGLILFEMRRKKDDETKTSRFVSEMLPKKSDSQFTRVGNLISNKAFDKTRFEFDQKKKKKLFFIALGSVITGVVIIIIFIIVLMIKKR